MIEEILIVNRRFFENGNEEDLFHTISNIYATINKEEGSVFKIYNVSSDSVKSMVKYLILNKIENDFLRNPLKLTELLILANHFQIFRLTNILVRCVQEHLSDDNAVYFFA